MNQITPTTERDFWWGHYQMWDWLSKNPDKKKEDWAGWGVYNNFVAQRYSCFACGFAANGSTEETVPDCKNCPIEWRITAGFPIERDTVQCTFHSSEFNEWDTAGTPEDKRMWAEIIRDLWEEPFRELEYRGIDDWNRPMFIQRGTKYYYSALDILFPYGESEAEVKKKVSEKDITFHGQSWDCDPMGTAAGKIKIMWSE